MEQIPSTTVTRSPGLYFDRASRGETFLLTRYGRPYAVLSPPPADQDTQDTNEIQAPQ